VHAHPMEIYFTSGGTESDNTALKGVAFANKARGNHIITSEIEHSAVLDTCRYLENHGFEVTYLPVDRFGKVHLEELRKAITDRTILISIMHANNEIGTIQPIEEIGVVARERKIYFHTDTVQTFGKLSIDVKRMKIDLLSVSAHKIYGPKGVGALYVRKGIKMDSLLHGGEQERKRRAGTENVPAIAGFGKAVELAKKQMEAEAQHLTKLRNQLFEGIQARVDGVTFNGHPTDRLPGTLNLSVNYVKGEALLLQLDKQGIYISTGSACASGSIEPSHVLLALGLSEQEARNSLRFSLGRGNTEQDITYVLTVFPEVVKKLREISALD
ncbi:MAG: cysteine desulfurase, partial [Nitrospira sp.]|nr:cysteine desulfurase [Nitrospira sp.]